MNIEQTLMERAKYWYPRVWQREMWQNIWLRVQQNTYYESFCEQNICKSDSLCLSLLISALRMRKQPRLSTECSIFHIRLCMETIDCADMWCDRTRVLRGRKTGWSRRPAQIKRRDDVSSCAASNYSVGQMVYHKCCMLCCIRLCGFWCEYLNVSLI